MRIRLLAILVAIAFGLWLWRTNEPVEDTAAETPRSASSGVQSHKDSSNSSAPHAAVGVRSRAGGRTRPALPAGSPLQRRIADYEALAAAGADKEKLFDTYFEIVVERARACMRPLRREGNHVELRFVFIPVDGRDDRWIIDPDSGVLPHRGNLEPEQELAALDCMVAATEGIQLLLPEEYRGTPGYHVYRGWRLD